MNVWSVFDETTLLVIHDHVGSSPDTEVGGFLVGTPEGADGPMRCAGAIPAPDARGDLTRLTFTHDSWEHVHRELEEHYPDSSLIGWYHSHPGHGIFLSEHDTFIQRHFFAAPWQIALVVDPVTGEEGLFAWDNDEISLIDKRSIGASESTFSADVPTALAARPVTAPTRERIVVEFDERPAPVTPPAEPDFDQQELQIRRRPVTAPSASPRSPVTTVVTAPHRPTRRRAARVRRRYPFAGHLLPVTAGLLVGVLGAFLRTL